MADSPTSVIVRIWKSLIAVLAGNTLYFFVLMPYLPPAARHRPNRLDLGVLVDFWICVVFYMLLDLVLRKSSMPRDRSGKL